MAISTFNQYIQLYAGDFTTNDWSDETLETKTDTWMQDGIKYVVNRVKQANPHLLHKFAKDWNGGTSESTGDRGEKYDIFNSSDVGELLHAYKQSSSKKYVAKRTDSSIAAYLGNTYSMYYATTESPAYFISGGEVFVYPSGGTTGFIQISYDTSVDCSDADMELTNFPDEYNVLPVLYTAEKVLEYKLGMLRKRLPKMPEYDGYADDNTGTEAAPTSAAEAEGWDVVRYFIESEEDSELAGSKIQELSGEQQQIIADYNWIQGQLQGVKEEFEQQFTSFFGVVGG